MVVNLFTHYICYCEAHQPYSIPTVSKYRPSVNLKNKTKLYFMIYNPILFIYVCYDVSVAYYLGAGTPSY